MRGAINERRGAIGFDDFGLDWESIDFALLSGIVCGAGGRGGERGGASACGDRGVGPEIVRFRWSMLYWSEESEAAALGRGDIGIAPTPSDPWTLGKCGFKIVQYMAAGLPVIASPVGANAEIVLGEKTGFLPGDFSDWPEAIAALAGDVRA